MCAWSYLNSKYGKHHFWCVCLSLAECALCALGMRACKMNKYLKHSYIHIPQIHFSSCFSLSPLSLVLQIQMVLMMITVQFNGVQNTTSESFLCMIYESVDICCHCSKHHQMYKVLPFVSLNGWICTICLMIVSSSLFFQVKDHKPNWIQLNEKYTWTATTTATTFTCAHDEKKF